MPSLPVDLIMLAAALEERGEMSWYLDLQTGDVGPVFDDPEEEERIENQPERFLLVEPLDPNPAEAFRAMEDFVSGLPQGEAKRDLERVLRRAKPFRNFRDALREWPEVGAQWLDIENKRKEDAVRAWLADNDITPVPRLPHA